MWLSATFTAKPWIIQVNVINYGNIEVELDVDTAPITVTNFVKLTQEDFYDGVTFWKIIDDFVIQGGNPTDNNGTILVDDQPVIECIQIKDWF